MKPKDELKVPQAMQTRYAEIIVITDAFCAQWLNAEYAQVARKLLAALARKRPSPLQNGRALTWAAGSLYALGQINFLFDKTQTPHMTAAEFCQKIGTTQSTTSNQAKKIRDLLNMSPFDWKWQLPSQHANSSAAWIIAVNGLMVDARKLPREIQEIAYEKGLIPYIPADRSD